VPTPEWFAENPKISAYISPEINDALKAWMEQNRVKKVSQALTTILEQHLGLVDAPKVITEGQYATLEQWQELAARVEALEKSSSPNKATAKIKTAPEARPTEQLTLENTTSTESSGDGRWLSVKEAHQLYGQSRTYDYFRKASVEKLKEEFGLEGDLDRKKEGKLPRLWIRKL